MVKNIFFNIHTAYVPGIKFVCVFFFLITNICELPAYDTIYDTGRNRV